MLTINTWLAIAESELEEKFIRSSGPGGQNVNKVATGVQLRFDVRNSPSLPEPVRQRLLQLAANRISAEGVLTVEANRFRTQERNRQDARDRLADWIRRATVRPRPRRPTKPSKAARQRRLDDKRRRGQRKRSRRATGDDGSL